MKNIKRAGLAFLSAFALAQITVSAQTPLVEYKFDETGSPASISSTGTNTITSTYTGTVGTAAGVGGGYAFQSSTAMGTGAGGVYASASIMNTTLKSFTLQGWFNSATVIGNAARVFDDNLTGASPAGFTLRAASSTETTYTGGLVLSVDGQSAYSGLNTFNDTSTWVFFAATYSYDATNSYVTFYKGTTSTAVTAVNSTPINMGINPLDVATNTVPLTIGNITAGGRSFQGLLDDMRIYGSATDGSGALNLSQLESIRALDAVPEPTSVALLAIGGFALLLVQFRLRRSTI